MMKIKFIIILFLFHFLVGCFGPNSSTQSASSEVATSQITSSMFAGIVSAQNKITGIQLKWAAAQVSGTVSVREYRVYRGTGKKIQLIATLPSETVSYVDGEVIWGNIYTYLVKAVDQNGVEDSNTKSSSSLSWGGIDRVVESSRTSLTVEFKSTTPLADEIRVYLEPLSGGTKTLAATITGSDTEALLSDLKVGYKYKVTAQAYVSSLKKEDGNDTYFSAVTKTQGYHTDGTNSFTWKNVANVRAFGPAPNANISPTNAEKTPASANAQVEIIFPRFSNLPTTTKYVVTRALAGEELNTSETKSCTSSTITSCRVCDNISGSGVLTCKDNQVAPSPAKYEYTISIKQVDATTSEEWVEPLPSEGSSAFKILVPIPPEYMVLTQRDAVNYELCKLMGRVPDPLEHNRCAYSGIGAAPYSSGHNKPALNLSPNYFDFGYNLFVDRYEAGCNWVSQSSGGMCGAGGTPGDCIGAGTSAPTSDKGKIGDVFYMLSSNPTSVSSNCYIKTGATTWTYVGSGNPILTDTHYQKIYTVDPKANGGFKPPFSNLEPGGMDKVCKGQIDPNYGRKRLPRMREFRAYAAWPRSDEPYGVASFSLLESGGGHPSVSNIYNCNTSNGSGYTKPADFSSLLIGNNEFLRTNNSYGMFHFIIGSVSTIDCQSRYGVQDAVGNIPEMVSDVFQDYLNTAPNLNTLVGGNSPYDNGNRDFYGLRMDGVTGFGGSGAPISVALSDTAKVKYVVPTLGIPLVISSSSEYMTAASFPNSADRAYFYRSDGIGNLTPFARSCTVGGSFGDSSDAGRWFTDCRSRPTESWHTLGFRCVMPAD